MSYSNKSAFLQKHVGGCASRLALGTVQFGKKYGIANSSGQVTSNEVESMLEFARISGIDTLDTAVAYGDSERILGSVGVDNFKIVSKIPSLSDINGKIDKFWVESQVVASLERLHVSSLYGLMLHAPDDLRGPNGMNLVCGLERVKEMGLVKKIGLSVYSPEQLSELIQFFQLDIVQIPFNLLDCRFADAGWLDILSINDVEIHARSVFLQGLLLMPLEQIPPKFAPYRSILMNLHEWLDSQAELTPISACLSHVAAYKSISRLVIGADNRRQLEEIVIAAAEPSKMAPVALSCPTSPLINPAIWSTF